MIIYYLIRINKLGNIEYKVVYNREDLTNLIQHDLEILVQFLDSICQTQNNSFSFSEINVCCVALEVK